MVNDRMTSLTSTKAYRMLRLEGSDKGWKGKLEGNLGYAIPGIFSCLPKYCVECHDRWAAPVHKIRKCNSNQGLV